MAQDWRSKNGKPHGNCGKKHSEEFGKLQGARAKLRIGSLHPNWKGGQIEKICIECEQPYLVYPYRKNSEFCSHSCVSRWHKDERAHNWKGGISKVPGYADAFRRKQLYNAEGSHTGGEWELLKIQYGFTCPSCGEEEPNIKLTQDHIIPLSRGGSDYIENIQPLCEYCNKSKFTKTIKYKNGEK